jgi:methionine synthase / methylenetetrahydrofolate reductase(NADPH)
VATLLDEIEDHPLCGDGAMGTLLVERGIAAHQCFEELCLSRPELISQIHSEYLGAGARIIETNSFGANAVRLARHGFSDRVSEINWQAAQLARQAAKEAFVAGSVGPLGVTSVEADRRGIDRESCFRAQMGALLEGGVDLIFLETFQDLDELLLALRVKQSLHHCPAICSLAPNEQGLLPDGTSLGDAFAKLVRHDADILGINCINGPQAALELVEHTGQVGLPLAVYPNAGDPRYCQGRYVYDISPEFFARIGAAIATRGARIIGGCCGTTPFHIAALSKVLAAGTITGLQQSP